VVRAGSARVTLEKEEKGGGIFKGLTKTGEREGVRGWCPPGGGRRKERGAWCGSGWSGGPGATVRVPRSKRFKLFQNSNGLKIFKIFYILIDLNLTFLSSKKLK
jgi:hypothetical protein